MAKIGEELDQNLTSAGYDEFIERRLPAGDELEERTGYSYEELGDILAEGDFVVLRPTTDERNIIQPTSESDIPFQIKNVGGTKIFTVDAANNRIGIGEFTSSPATTLDLSSNSNTSALRIRGLASSGANTGAKFPDTQSGIDGDWGSLSSVEASDNVRAASVTNNSTAEFTDFSFTGIEEAIVGIELTIEARTNNTGGAGATIDNIILSWNGGTSWTSTKNIGSNLGLSDVTYTVGGATDTWGRTWGEDDFTDANFAMRLDNNNADSVGSTQIDYIAITVYHSGGAVSTTEIADIYVGDLGNLVLDLTSGNTTSQFIDLRPEDNEYGLVLRESDGTGTTALANFYVVDGSPDYLSINVTGTTDTDALNITSGDNVGIGTAAPGVKLHVLGDNTQAIRVEGATSSELGDIYMGSNNNMILDTTAGGGTNGWIEFRPEGANHGLILRESDGTGITAWANFYVVDSSTNYLSITINSNTDTDALNIDASDNVGIGGLPTLGKLEVVGNIAVGGSNNELRFYESTNYVGFEAPALSADQIWVLPDADGSDDDLLQTDGSGNLSWGSIVCNGDEVIVNNDEVVFL